MHYNNIIIGGGIVGATLALALQKQQIPIALIDASPAPPINDSRLIALNDGSVNLFKHLRIWPALAAHGAPIKTVHVSKRGQFGAVRIAADELDLDSLGYVIPAKIINAVLYAELQKSELITLYQPALLNALAEQADQVQLSITKASQPIDLTADFVIGADGTDSTVRKLLAIPTEVIDYQQSAIVTITQLKDAHQNSAYERFVDQGAIALLPLLGKEMATIWSGQDAYIQTLMSESSDAFLHALQKEFGFRLGLFEKIGERSVFPLRMVKAKTAGRNKIILMGNALHTMHPIAAQGLNLALYEVAVLCESLQHPKNLGFSQKMSLQLSHHLNTLFSNDFFMLNAARSLGMIGLDICLPAKKCFMKAALHHYGRVPRLWLRA